VEASVWDRTRETTARFLNPATSPHQQKPNHRSLNIRRIPLKVWPTERLTRPIRPLWEVLNQECPYTFRIGYTLPGVWREKSDWKWPSSCCLTLFISTKQPESLVVLTADRRKQKLHLRAWGLTCHNFRVDQSEGRETNAQ